MHLNKRQLLLHRGYSYISRYGFLSKINHVVTQIGLSFNVDHSSCRTSFPYSTDLNLSICLHQRLCQCLNYYSSFKKYLTWGAARRYRRCSTLISPLPISWSLIHNQEGIPTSIIRSYLLFYILCVVQLLKAACYGIKAIVTPLSHVNLPRRGVYCLLPNQHDLHLFNNLLTVNEKNNVLMALGVDLSKTTLYELPSFSSILYSKSPALIWELVSVTANSLLTCLTPRHSHVFLLRDIIALIVAQANLQYLTEHDVNVTSLLFSCSHLHVKPLYTYELAKFKLESHIFFYSRNNIGLSSTFPAYRSTYIWELMNWSSYLVLGQENLRFFVEYNHSPSLFAHQTTYIDISDQHQVPIVSTPNKYSLLNIIVYDVTPRCSEEYIQLLQEHDYYSTKVSINFLHDILEAFASHRFPVFLSPKKNLSICRNKKYIRAVNRLQATYPSFFVGKSKAALAAESPHIKIAFPFTSALLTKSSACLSSIYYDTTATIHPDSLAKGTFQLVAGYQQLHSWAMDYSN